ncbi:MAG: PfkB family carbohydrate kinase [Pseudomonadales bacterium]|jgi:adenosine kinase|nr:PfkB family carbohydrate kinase [Pseudomonadales bacterium]MDP6472673.1 PfkB family carbohydrate kinase [Pseudomonadales bacterium]MDP6827885.1 PfkB family carbohydrate kinase [Pseudomonadales bacterium]MDP6972693.1 PfkB family carbohydrate kinase [Pseudomonadales bacterium]|tara:strand:- start:2141 stop:3019 length:879 start_codon:yes stop_codon:yes gene_type:complete
MSPILVIGTLAYDLLATHDDFGPGERRNIKLQSITQTLGGCAGNIAYNLRHLGSEPIPVATVGLDDYHGYREHLRDLDINEAGVLTVPDATCPRGFIFTAPDQSQLTAFYPGPVGNPAAVSRRMHALLSQYEPAAVIIAPEQSIVVQAAANALRGHDTIPMIWSPGQYSAHLPADLAGALAELADVIIVNRAEMAELETVMPAAASGTANCTFIITDGSGDVTARGRGISARIPVAPRQSVDPTGCGDAFTAAFAHAWLAGHPIEWCARRGIDLAAACLAETGAQCHFRQRV